MAEGTLEGELRVKEIIDDRVVDVQEVYTDVVAGILKNRKDASMLLERSQRTVPLAQFGLGHLKRLRRVNEVCDEDTLSECVHLEFIIHPCSFNFSPGDIHESYKDEIDYLLSYMESVRIVTVAKIEPICRIEFDTWNQSWPITFHPTAKDRRKQIPICKSDLLIIKNYMKLVEQDHIICSGSGISEGAINSLGGIIVNPINSMIIATCSDAVSYLKSTFGNDCLEKNPLYTSTMLCIELVSAIVRYELPNNGRLPDDQYLCTGLDIYLFHEPDIMSAMALVHSRIKRAYYIQPSPDDGGIGTFYKLHELRWLNHHYRSYNVSYMRKVDDEQDIYLT